MSNREPFVFRDLIARKRDGGVVLAAEWEPWIKSMINGSLPDYQVAAFLMAVFFRGLDDGEVVALTGALAASGEQITWGPGPYVDKHSTGGVGDAVTLVAVPWAAACGAKIPKLSGRGLGLTGGTIDKLDSIPGLITSLPTERFRAQVEDIGWAVAKAGALAPADKRLYELRDATATVACRPLIVASILSKKFAAGAPALVFDVKCGAGSFAPDEDAALDLARALVRGAVTGGRRATAFITAMDQPLGRSIGNALEVKEAVAVLQGKAGGNLLAVAKAMAHEMVVLSGAVAAEDAPALLDQTLAGGYAFEKFEAMARAQGAKPGWLTALPTAAGQLSIKAAKAGFVRRIDARNTALAARALGAGRETKEDALDPAAGIVCQKEVGEKVVAGETVLTLHYSRRRRLQEAEEYARAAVEIGAYPEMKPLVLNTIRD